MAHFSIYSYNLVNWLTEISSNLPLSPISSFSPHPSTLLGKPFRPVNYIHSYNFLNRLGEFSSDFLLSTHSSFPAPHSSTEWGPSCQLLYIHLQNFVHWFCEISLHLPYKMTKLAKFRQIGQFRQQNFVKSTIFITTHISFILYQSCHCSPEQAYHKADMVLVQLSYYLSFY